MFRKYFHRTLQRRRCRENNRKYPRTPIQKMQFSKDSKSLGKQPPPLLIVQAQNSRGMALKYGESGTTQAITRKTEMMMTRRKKER